MKTGKQILEEHGVVADENGHIPASEISKSGLPVVVACCCCTMTMTILSAKVDDEGYVYCGDCAPVIADIR